MNSGLIGKIEKARRYAQERNRIHIDQLHLRFEGENDAHEVELRDGHWRCTCDFFAGWDTCSHTMALERVLDGMLPATALEQEARAAAR